MNSCFGVIIGLVILLLVAVVIAFALSFSGLKKAGFRQNCTQAPCDFGLVCTNLSGQPICLRARDQPCLLNADCATGTCLENRCAPAGTLLEKVTPVAPLGSVAAPYTPLL